MTKGLAYKKQEEKKAKAKAKAHFAALYAGQDWWKDKRVIGKRAATSSVCSISGCVHCSKKAYWCITKDWYNSKTAYIDDNE